MRRFECSLRWCLLGIASSAVLLCLLMTLRAQEPDAERAFTGAARLFEGGWYDRAEAELSAFLVAHPNSTNRIEAVLLQAQSRFQLRNYEAAIQLLEAHRTNAGPAADQFLYWLAQAQSELANYEAAASTYAELLKSHAASPLRLEASVGEAWARFKLGDTARTVELLKASGSAFEQAARATTNQGAVLRGNFLLAEALFAQKNFQAAELTLNEIAARGIQPEAEWERQYLLARIETLDGRGDAALARVTNLVLMATARSNAVLQARSLTLKGEVLEEKEPGAAAEAYRTITQLPGVSVEQTRQALLRLADLAVGQNQFTNAVNGLAQFLQQNPQDPATDLIRLSLGEIHLKQYQSLLSDSGTLSPSAVPHATNLLQVARGHFEFILNQLTNSAYFGKASLGRGWCLWEEAQLQGDTAKWLECQVALQVAIARLPTSLDHARARFKLGDVYLQRRDYTNAAAQFRLLAEQYSDVPEVRDTLLDQTLSQGVRASIDSGDLPSAKAALETLLRDFPKSPEASQAMYQVRFGIGRRRRV
ncbi:MAG: tol-pal system YbgF family protein [Verrucomicrobiia bacterium]